MSFAVAADSYDRFMGRYSSLLAAPLADFAGIGGGEEVLDVGSGPGALTAELAGRVGAGRVTAIDPSEAFVAALRERHPGVRCERASAEEIPFADDSFDASLAQLVVHFMADPVAGVGEMARVTRPGGVVAVSVWDHAGGRSPLSLFWRAARERDAAVDDESRRAGAREGALAQLLRDAGLRDVDEAVHTVTVEHQSFEDWWEPFTLGVGPAGAYLASLGERERAELRERCRELAPDEPFVVSARAWAARGSP